MNIFFFSILLLHTGQNRKDRGGRDHEFLTSLSRTDSFGYLFRSRQDHRADRCDLQSLDLSRGLGLLDLLLEFYQGLDGPCAGRPRRCGDSRFGQRVVLLLFPCLRVP